MFELVSLVVPLLKTNEDAEIVLAGVDANTGASELGRDLVEASGSKAAFGTVDGIGANGWVMRGLFGEIGYSDRFRGRSSDGVVGDREGEGRSVFAAFRRPQAG